MTDNSAAEKGALLLVWATARQLLCHFHVGQAEWDWLLTGKNGISSEDRRPLMNKFRDVRIVAIMIMIDGILESSNTHKS